MRFAPGAATVLLVTGILLSNPTGLCASGDSSEPVKGIGVGLDVLSKGANPVPSAGILWGSFGYLSYYARGTFSYRSADSTGFIRGGVAAGFIFFLLNFDLTMQTGDQRSAGMFWGLSAFLPMGYFVPEVFAGYQLNFSANTENYFIAGLKGYFNFAAIKN